MSKYIKCQTAARSVGKVKMGRGRGTVRGSRRAIPAAARGSEQQRRGEGSRLSAGGTSRTCWWVAHTMRREGSDGHGPVKWKEGWIVPRMETPAVSLALKVVGRQVGGAGYGGALPEPRSALREPGHLERVTGSRVRLPSCARETTAPPGGCGRAAWPARRSPPPRGPGGRRPPERVSFTPSWAPASWSPRESFGAPAHMPRADLAPAHPLCLWLRGRSSSSPSSPNLGTPPRGRMRVGPSSLQGWT